MFTDYTEDEADWMEEEDPNFRPGQVTQVPFDDNQGPPVGVAGGLPGVGRGGGGAGLPVENKT